MKNKKVHKFPNETNFTRRANTTVKVLCMLLAMFAATGYAQTSVSRSSAIIAGASPFQDSLWTFNATDYSLVKRIQPTVATGEIITGINGIATDPITGINYCIVKLFGIPQRRLATIDIQSGICNLIGSLGDNFSSLAFNANGTLFGVTGDGAATPSTMYRISTVDATKTFFMTLGNGGDGEVIAYCPDNNFFYHWSGNSGNLAWERFDTTGAGTIENLAYTDNPSEIFGAIYIGGGNFVMSDINSNLYLWDTLGNVSLATPLTTAPDDIRGLVRQSTTSTLSTTTATTFCDGGDVLITASAGTDYQWYMDGVAISGETNATYTATMSGNYNATFTDALGINDSMATGIVVTVNPNPVLTSATSTSVCNNSALGYIQAGTDVASFHWGREGVAHITNLPANGTGNINEVLVNDTAIQIPVVYTDTLISAQGCTSIYNITVTVNPTLSLYPAPLVGSLCNGDNFHFESTSQTPASDLSYSWGRDAYPGNPAANGTGAIIDEVLVNTGTSPFVVTYVDTLRAYGCENLQLVQVSVNPTPALTSTLTPSSVCDSALFHYEAVSATSGVTTGTTGSISWTRGTVTGIANGPASGADTVNEYLDNTTDNPIAVTYVFTVSANGCTNNTIPVTVFVNPTPRLNTTLTPSSVCDSSLFHYVSGTNTGGATIAWSRAAVAGISNTAATGGAADINEYLNNTTANPIVVTYAYTLTIDGCSHTDNVKVTVNPTPVINTAAPAPICDSTIFSFAPASATTGPVTYAWSRAFVSGIGVLPNSGTGNPNERLKNNTYTSVDVAYVYTVTANGCSHIQTVNVTVRPTPRLTSAHTGTVCSGVEYMYVPSSLTTGVTYAWSRAAVASLTPSTRSGSGIIKDTITNTSATDKIASYAIVLNISGCTHTETLDVTVQPAATPAIIAVTPPASLCSGSLYQNFGAATAPPAGAEYTWTATNATVQATGSTGQYAIVNFDQPGTAVVTLSSALGNGCKGSASYTVNVGTSSATLPEVIYTSGHFACLQNDVEGFQWGYDDAATLDSNMIPGAIDQSYFLSTPDFANRYYWVMTKSSNGCIKKAYYNAPTGVADVNTGMDMIVYPNPASSNVTVAINTNVSGTIKLDVVNMLGQKVNAISTNDHKTVIDVANLAPGYYVIDCYIDGLKIGATKFLKN